MQNQFLCKFVENGWTKKKPPKSLLNNFPLKLKTKKLEQNFENYKFQFFFQNNLCTS